MVNADIEIDASDSYDLDGDIEEYYYDFGDNTVTDWIKEPIVIHQYSSEGKYTISLLVKDNLRKESEPVTLEITITKKINQAPSVSITYPDKDESVAGLVIVRGTAVDPEENIDAVYVLIDNGDFRALVITKEVYGMRKISRDLQHCI